ncbi:SseB family protein [Streptomyces radicis]|uniref:SseB family protein n=1 Tax=Streptomyces radicis TaxID=1750517 RepID=A0A3A9WY62_9ACTN|nr:SseB family protein [Streptomyces radicis]RKN12746.1 SseB family protein [Streptomyces radicis]RKN27492.1 SseB family protein [Streptomyces radicis]
MPLNIPTPAFADDDGTADPALARALADWARDPAAEPAVLTALGGARLLVPVVAVLGEAETGEDGPRREKSSEMAVLTLALPGGRRALPVFTATETLARWRPDARPVPVTTRQALAAAVQEGAGALVVDIAGPVAYELAGAGLRAVAGGGSPASAPAVAEAVRDVLAAEPAVAAAHLVPGGDADATLALRLDGGAEDAPAVTRLAHALAGDEVLRAHLVRGLQLAVLPPGAALPGEPTYRR